VKRFFCALSFLLFTGVTSCAGDTAHGEQIFKICASCHNNAPDAIGPSLKGIIGRKSGSIEGFRYSNAIKRANLIWTADRLRAFLHNPQAEIKGNRMPYSGLQNDIDLDDLISFIETLN